jgi:YcaO-like protein with predicted kinase domain
MNPSDLQKRLGVSRLADVTGLDIVGMPVVAAIRPRSRNLTVSFGKGKTYEDACISALMESAELYYSEHVPSDLPQLSFSDMPTGTVLHPRQFCKTRSEHDLGAVPLSWINAMNMTTGNPTLVPWPSLSMDKTEEGRRANFGMNPSATGLAADFDESRAVLHALNEVVERHAHQQWNTSSDETRRHSFISIQGFQELACFHLVEKLQDAGFGIFVWNLTGETAIPCIMVEIIDFGESADTAYVQGVAADLNFARAFEQALAEAIQIRLTYISGARDDLDWSDYGSRYEQIIHNRKTMRRPQCMSSATLIDTRSVLNASNSISEILRRLRLHGHGDALLVHLTEAHDPLRVVKILVPAMEDIQN